MYSKESPSFRVDKKENSPDLKPTNYSLDFLYEDESSDLETTESILFYSLPDAMSQAYRLSNGQFEELVTSDVMRERHQRVAESLSSYLKQNEKYIDDKGRSEKIQNEIEKDTSFESNIDGRLKPSLEEYFAPLMVERRVKKVEDEESRPRPVVNGERYLKEMGDSVFSAKGEDVREQLRKIAGIQQSGDHEQYIVNLRDFLISKELDKNFILHNILYSNTVSIELVNYIKEKTGIELSVENPDIPTERGKDVVIKNLKNHLEDSLKERTDREVDLSMVDGKWVVIDSGEEIKDVDRTPVIGEIEGLEGKEIENLDGLTDIGGKLAFAAKVDGKSEVIYDNQVIKHPEGKKMKRVETLTDIGGKLAFAAKVDGKSEVIYDNQVIKDPEGKEIENPYALTDIGGKLAFAAKVDGKWEVIYDNQVIKHPEDKEMERVNYLTDIGGKLAFAAKVDGKWEVIYDNQVIEHPEGKEIERVNLLTDIGGKLAFRAEVNIRSEVIYDNQVIKHPEGWDIERIDTLTDIGGKLAFVAKVNGKWEVIYDNQVIEHPEGKEIENPYELTDIGGKLAFRAEFDGKWEVIYDNQVIKHPEGWDIYRIDTLTDIGGKLAFRAEVNIRSEVIYDNQVIELPTGTTDYILNKTGILGTGKKDEKYFSFEINLANDTLTLLQSEEDELDLLNKISKSTDEILKESGPETIDSLEERFRKSQLKMESGARTINRSIKDNPKKATELFPAVPDKRPSHYAQRIASKLFPEIERNRIKNDDRPYSYIGGNFYESTPKEKELTALDYLNPNTQPSIEGGDPKEGFPKHILTLDSEYSGLLKTNILSPTKGSPEKVSLEVEFEGKESKIGGTLDSSIYGKVVFPTPVYTTEVLNGGQTVKEDNGNYSANLNDRSFEYKYIEDHAPIPTMSSEDYNKWVESREDIEDERLLEEIASLSTSDSLFLKSIEGDSLKDKLIKIEKYARSIGHYDIDNGSVMGAKRGRSPEELFEMMRDRMGDLKEKEEGVNGKQIAGVCADFAQHTTHLLRHAGIPSAVAVGFASSGTEVTTLQAHAITLAYIPTEKGITYVELDGTPDGFGESLSYINSIRRDSLEERDKDAISKLEKGQSEKINESEIKREELKKKKLDEINKIIEEEGISSFKERDQVIEAIEALNDSNEFLIAVPSYIFSKLYMYKSKDTNFDEVIGEIRESGTTERTAGQFVSWIEERNKDGAPVIELLKSIKGVSSENENKILDIMIYFLEK